MASPSTIRPRHRLAPSPCRARAFGQGPQASAPRRPAALFRLSAGATGHEDHRHGTIGSGRALDAGARARGRDGDGAGPPRARPRAARLDRPGDRRHAAGPRRQCSCLHCRRSGGKRGSDGPDRQRRCRRRGRARRGRARDPGHPDLDRLRLRRHPRPALSGRRPVGPISAYGRSKLAGEEAVAAANPNHGDPPDRLGLQPLRQELRQDHAAAGRDARRGRRRRRPGRLPDQRPRHRGCGLRRGASSGPASRRGGSARRLPHGRAGRGGLGRCRRGDLCRTRAAGRQAVAGQAHRDPPNIRRRRSARQIRGWTPPGSRRFMGLPCRIGRLRSHPACAGS